MVGVDDLNSREEIPVAVSSRSGIRVTVLSSEPVGVEAVVAADRVPGVGVAVLTRLPIGVDIVVVVSDWGEKITGVFTPLAPTRHETSNSADKSDKKLITQNLEEKNLFFRSRTFAPTDQ